MAGKLSVGVSSTCVAPMRLEQFSLRLYRFLGVDSLFVPDHYVSFVPKLVWGPHLTPAAEAVPSPDAFFDPFVMLGMMAARHKRVRLGTGVTEAFRRHPATLAQAFVTLDHLTSGRSILGIGNGERENTEPYGIPFKKRVARLSEALTIIRMMWESGGEPLDFQGDFWSLRQAIFATPLYKRAAPTVWIASHAPRMLELTGRLGDGWYPTQKMSADEYAGKLAQIHAAAAERRRSLKGFEPAKQILVAIGADKKQAAKQLLKVPVTSAMMLLLPGAAWAKHGREHPLGANFEGFADFVPQEITPEHLEAAGRQVNPELLDEGIYVGSIKEIAAEVEPLAKAGLRHVVLWNLGPLAAGPSPAAILQFARLIWRLQRISTR